MSNRFFILRGEPGRCEHRPGSHLRMTLSEWQSHTSEFVIARSSRDEAIHLPGKELDCFANSTSGEAADVDLARNDELILRTQDDAARPNKKPASH